MRLTQAITMLILSELLVRIGSTNTTVQAGCSTSCHCPIRIPGRRTTSDLAVDLHSLTDTDADVQNLGPSITPYQAAKRLGISHTSVYARIRNGLIVSVKLHATPDCGPSCRCPIRIPVRQLSSAESGS